MADTVAFSVDLEPNLDNTMDGVRDAMMWFDQTVPRGTVFATYRIATEAPDLLAMLAESHEIGVHVHPREFDHKHDQFAKLSRDRQRELIGWTRAAIDDATGTEPISFRAGRHSINYDTLDVLAELGFTVDASINVRYDKYLPAALMDHSEPFKLDGLFEVPVTYGTLPIISVCGFRALTERPVTATAATLRADRWGCSGISALTELATNSEFLSFYMHPYDATDYHDLENSGEPYRRRAETLIDWLSDTTFVTIEEVIDN